MMPDQLTKGTDDLEVVSIVGMGGIGNVLICLLSSICGKTDQTYEEQDDWQLADQLQKLLKGPRYLIVIDDIWAKDAWDYIKLCFPDCNCRSRILLTTRNMEVAEYASSGKPPYQMRLLNSDESWCLLYGKVFVKDCFSPEFEQPVEGFLKVDEIKSVEEVAKKCLKDLVDRSLIFIHNVSNFDGKIKACGMHDVIRELCLREARIMNFVNVVERKNDQNPTLSLSPGLQRHLREDISSSIDIPSSISRLCYLQVFILKLSRHKVRRHPFILPSEILTMQQLRRLSLDWNYLQYHEPTEESLVLKNLQFLSGWNPLYCTGSVFRLFPNLRKLQIHGIQEDFLRCKDLYDFCFLDQLDELEFCLSNPNFSCFLESFTTYGATPQDITWFMRRKQPEMMFLERPSQLLPRPGAFPFIPLRPARTLPPLLLSPPDAFPQNLKFLAFSGTSFWWKNLNIVGKLPKLESLKLAHDAYIGYEWEVFEEGFPCLKFLQLKELGIWYWRASCDHFPCLERLSLNCCRHLVSIPQDFADITVGFIVC
ncbi:hypothetical protein CQW23_06318 [Capsicum baccatum]|uniref:Uncharacterized protein n=1 Tax=Capsicum baccatum TaxID=33114 RepID=A0A2G2X2Y6_CAPBA|nr:hypothetical protein CQW23_06318 [Capsicum baccatum]